MIVLADEGVEVMGVPKRLKVACTSARLAFVLLQPFTSPVSFRRFVARDPPRRLGTHQPHKVRRCRLYAPDDHRDGDIRQRHIKEPLLGHRMTLDGFYEYSIRPHQSTMTRYDCLVKALAEGKYPGSKLKALMDGHLWLIVNDTEGDSDSVGGDFFWSWPHTCPQ